jgi:hypothetical protein
LIAFRHRTGNDIVSAGEAMDHIFELYSPRSDNKIALSRFEIWFLSKTELVL